MKYSLIRGKLKITELILYLIIIVLLNLFLEAYGVFYILLDIVIVSLFFYRLYQYLFFQYPIELETKEKELVIIYDKGLKRHLNYSHIHDVEVIWYEHNDNGRLYIYLKDRSALKKLKTKIFGKLEVDQPTGKKIVKDIKKRTKLI